MVYLVCSYISEFIVFLLMLCEKKVTILKVLNQSNNTMLSLKTISKRTSIDFCLLLNYLIELKRLNYVKSSSLQVDVNKTLFTITKNGKSILRASV